MVFIDFQGFVRCPVFYFLCYGGQYLVTGTGAVNFIDFLEAININQNQTGTGIMFLILQQLQTVWQAGQLVQNIGLFKIQQVFFYFMFQKVNFYGINMLEDSQKNNQGSEQQSQLLVTVLGMKILVNDNTDE